MEVTETQSFMVSMCLTPLLHSHLLTPHQSLTLPCQEGVSRPRPGEPSVCVQGLCQDNGSSDGQFKAKSISVCVCVCSSKVISHSIMWNIVRMTHSCFWADSRQYYVTTVLFCTYCSSGVGYSIMRCSYCFYFFFFFLKGCGLFRRCFIYTWSHFCYFRTTNSHDFNCHIQQKPAAGCRRQ